MWIRKLASLGSLLALAILTGCVEGEYSSVVYPDGSGKIVYSFRAPLDAFLVTGMTEEHLELGKEKALEQSLYHHYSGLYINPDTIRMEAIEGKLYYHAEFVFEDINEVKDPTGKPFAQLAALENGDFQFTLMLPPEGESVLEGIATGG